MMHLCEPLQSERAVYNIDSNPHSPLESQPSKIYSRWMSKASSTRCCLTYCRPTPLHFASCKYWPLNGTSKIPST